ncbi:hypothetical protein ACFLRP_00300 [Bacteroidota bacterium]
MSGREKRMVRSKRGKRQRDSQIEVVCNWRHVTESSPLFKRLMTLLLQPKTDQMPERQQESKDSYDTR